MPLMMGAPLKDGGFGVLLSTETGPSAFLGGVVGAVHVTYARTER